MTKEHYPQEDPMSEHEDKLRAMGFDEDDINAIRDFRENATDEQRSALIDTTIELRREFMDSGIYPLEIVAGGLDGFLSGEDDRSDKPPLFFDGRHVEHGLSDDEWSGLDETTKQTLREPNID